MQKLPQDHLAVSGGQQVQARPPQYDAAVAIVRAFNTASISTLQRRLNVGYNAAARLIEEMERRGVVTPCDTTGHRSVCRTA